MKTKTQVFIDIIIKLVKELFGYLSILIVCYLVLLLVTTVINIGFFTASQFQADIDWMAVHYFSLGFAFIFGTLIYTLSFFNSESYA